MLTFLQFLIESEEIAGWTSPHGSVHLFHHRDEHINNHHPEIAAAIKKQLQKKHQEYRTNPSLAAAMKRGYARIRSNGEHHDIHFDSRSKGGKEAALHSLRYLKPGPIDRIIVNHRPWNNTARDIDSEHEFRKASDAAAHIRNL